MLHHAAHSQWSGILFYEFQADDGERIDRHYPVSKAPKLGAKIVSGGKVYRRIISTNQSVGVAYDFGSYPKVSSTLPQFCDGAEHVESGNQRGKAIIESRQHENNLCRQHGFTRDYDHKDLDHIEKADKRDHEQRMKEVMTNGI